MLLLFAWFQVRLARAPRATVQMESVADLETLAEKCNPVVGFWDPIGLTANGVPASRLGPPSVAAAWGRRAWPLWRPWRLWCPW